MNMVTDALAIGDYFPNKPTMWSTQEGSRETDTLSMPDLASLTSVFSGFSLKDVKS